jgi:flagellar biosynthesis protein FlhB
MALIGALREGILVLFVSVGSLAVVALVVGIAQTKALFCPAQLVGGFQQYKPGAYLSRIRQNTVDSLAGCVRCVCVVVLVAPVLLIAGTLSPGGSLGSFFLLGSLLRSVMLRGAIALTVIAAVSYGISRWKFMRQYRMSLQEMKDEHKEDEGDPHAKAARKHEHKMLLFAEIEKRVRSSKVIVVSRMPD